VEFERMVNGVAMEIAVRNYCTRTSGRGQPSGLARRVKKKLKVRRRGPIRRLDERVLTNAPV
jgi:hypothetical protein